MGGSTSRIVSSVISPVTAPLTYLSNQAQKQRREMRTALDQQKDAQRAQEEELRKRREQEQKNKLDLAVQSAFIRSKRGSAISNKSGTILTSPLGLPQPALNGAGAGKTLLGT